MKEYQPLFQRLESLRLEMERVAEHGNETEEFLRLRRQLLSLEMEITDLRIGELVSARRDTAHKAAPAPQRGGEASPPSLPGAEPAAVRPADAPRSLKMDVPPLHSAQARPAPPLSRPKPQPGPSRRAGKTGWSILGMSVSESSIGKYIISLLACLLLLLGCCVLILMGWSHMSRLVKAAVIALGGGGFLAVGLGLVKKLPKSFSDSLTACGLCILYADVVALYQAWALVPLWGVLLLILAWDGACILLGKRHHTKMFFYVLALGNFMTGALVCQLISNGPFAAASILFVGCALAGAILACRKFYQKFDPVLVLAAGATALYMDLAYFGAVFSIWRGYAPQPGFWLMLSLALCLGLSWLLLWSAGWTVEFQSKKGGRAAYLCLAIPVLLATFPLGSALSEYAAVYFGVPAVQHHLALILASVGAAGLLAAPRTRREAYCLCAPVLLVSAESLGRHYGLDATGAGLAALGAAVVYALRRTRLSQWVCALAYAVYGCLLWSISGLTAYYAAMVPGLLFPALLIFLWRKDGSKRRAVGVLLCTDAVAVVLLCGAGLALWRLPSLLLLLVLGAVLAVLPVLLKDIYDKFSVLELHSRVQDFVFAALLLGYTRLYAPAGALALSLSILLLFVHGLKLLYRAYFGWEGKNQTWWGVAAAAVFSLSVLQCAGLTPAGNLPIFLSLLCLALAAGYIVLGFYRKAKPLRIFGLVLSIASVLKMVTLDVAGSLSLLRVAALVVGGLICLAISFLYYRMEQRQAEKQLKSEKGANEI